MLFMTVLFNKFVRSVKNKRVVIWGLGLNQGGLEAAKYFAKLGADVLVVDSKTKKELAASVKKLKNFPRVRFSLGKQEEADFKGADLIIKNPAISWELPLVKKLLREKLRIETDVTLFFRFFKGRIVGVTGSKGKTTTTTLVGKFLKGAKKNILLGGNIRVSLFSFLKEKYLNDRRKIAVLELSSFQLEDLAFVKKSPNVAVVTNILRDHLNRYGSYTKYAAAKKNICLYQNKNDYLILNIKDKKLKEFEKCSRSRVIPACAGIQIVSNNSIFFSKNNQSNLVLAIATANIFKINKSVIEKVAESFKGVPYRMEKIAVIKKITFINDTTATIPDAAINNLNSFEKKVILIGGGSDKNLKFAKFAKTIAKKVKKLILLPGNATPLIAKELKKYAPKLEIVSVDSMDKAVKKAYKSASAGDVVLLSPGATSFGLFKNEFDRGDQFNKAVRKLK